jgi:uncharacterized Zn-finger protein
MVTVSPISWYSTRNIDNLHRRVFLNLDPQHEIVQPACHRRLVLSY